MRSGAVVLLALYHQSLVVNSPLSCLQLEWLLKYSFIAVFLIHFFLLPIQLPQPPHYEALNMFTFTALLHYFPSIFCAWCLGLSSSLWKLLHDISASSSAGNILLVLVPLFRTCHSVWHESTWVHFAINCSIGHLSFIKLYVLHFVNLKPVGSGFRVSAARSYVGNTCYVTSWLRWVASRNTCFGSKDKTA